ncbi:response regulator [Hanamia caeni]|jgi:DNA-binding response OmpR family regulator|uniref:Response regulator n=1 Tax=Hanamia caeni TaxID=2294116 RepID=A0A3M9NDE0_9BACT|nr:response regulator [Hanamia caeni]RNI35327.1 response regulator [Hanamia caeni]
MKILVAEDEMIMLKTIELRLKKDGHEIITCSDGREAILKIDETNPDLIITDIMMPFASGLEIIEAVKRKDGKHTKVIVLSAMGQENVVLEAFQLGADDFITKPFSPNELSMRVKRYTPLTFAS